MRLLAVKPVKNRFQTELFHAQKHFANRRVRSLSHHLTFIRKCFPVGGYSGDIIINSAVNMLMIVFMLMIIFMIVFMIVRMIVVVDVVIWHGVILPAGKKKGGCRSIFQNGGQFFVLLLDNSLIQISFNASSRAPMMSSTCSSPMESRINSG